MTNKRNFLMLLLALVTAFGFATLMIPKQKPRFIEPLLGEAAPETIVRFYYLPPNSYEHPALIFRVVLPGDRRLGTAPIANLGARTPYISMAEMQHLLTALASSTTGWHRATTSKKVTPVSNEDVTDEMTISIFSSDYPIEKYLRVEEMCQTLSPLDNAFSQPRALWEFQLFRIQYGCQVQNFDRNAYPQHDVE